MTDRIKEFTFDVKLFSTVRMKASSEEEARLMIAGILDCADANFGCHPETKDPFCGEVSLDGEADLVEVDGEAV